MSQCEPTGGGRWPDTRPCGAHGSCVPNALWGSGLSTAQFVCDCDSGWSSSGDFAFSPNEHCHITLAGLLPMWSIALLAVLIVTTVFVRVVRAYALILREQEARKKRAQDDASEKHTPASLGLWKRIKLKAALAFIFIFNNPTRTCLFTVSLCLLGFGVLSLTKLIEIARRFRSAEDRGGVFFEDSEDMLIGLHVFPTVLYCISSMAFILSGAFSSLIWCASAQAFYTRAEGSALRLNTQKELGIASIIHISCYILPGIAVVLGRRLSALDARPSLSGGALSPYETVVALHFQLKALVPLATYIVDVRLARLVILNLKKHDVAMHAKTMSGTGASAGTAGTGSGLVEPSRQSLGAASSGKGMVAGSVIAAPASSAALPEQNDVSRIGRASLSVSRAPLDRAPSTNPLFMAAASTSLTLPAGATSGPARPGSAGLVTHVRRPSLPLVPKGLAALKRPLNKKLHRRNNSADSPITAGQTLKIRMEAAAASAPGPSSRSPHAAGGASDLEDLTSRPLQQPLTQSARLPPQHTKYAVVSDARSASPLGAVSSGPVITYHRPTPSRPPTLPSPSNRSTMRASGVQLSLSDALVPARITPSPVRFHTAETDTDVPINSRPPSLDPRTGSGVWGAVASSTPSPKAAASLDGKSPAVRKSIELSAAALLAAAERRRSLQPAAALPRRTTLNLPSTGGTSSNTGNVVIHMSKDNSSMRRGTVTTMTTTTVSSAGQTGATGAGAGAGVAAVSAQKSQAEMAEEQRAKLLEFCKRLAKHNRTTRSIAAVWLVVNTLFGWVPLLRSFTSYILPIQVLATVLAIFTLLRTLSPKDPNKGSGKAETGMGAVNSETNAASNGGGGAAAVKEKSMTSAKTAAAAAPAVTAGTTVEGSRRGTQQRQPHRLTGGAVSPSPSPTHHGSSPSPVPALAFTMPAASAVPSAVELMTLQPVTPSESETPTQGDREEAAIAAVTAAVSSPLGAGRPPVSPANPASTLPGRVPPSASPVLSSIPASLRKQMAQDEESPRTPGRRSVHMSQRRLAHVEGATP